MNNGKSITLDHGSGGLLSRRLIEKTIVPFLSNPELARLDDSAVVDIGGLKLAFTTDSYVIDPVFFPGGDIGRLAVCGTVNDLSMSGARPLYLSLSFIVEEGFRISDFNRIMKSIKDTAQEAGVLVVTGDTKVVPKGNADNIFINTAGIGIIPCQFRISAANARAGDTVIVSGTIGDHGSAVLAHRMGMDGGKTLMSDVAPLNSMIRRLLDSNIEVHVLKDPTRGGVAGVLNEIAEKSDVTVVIEESLLPLRDDVSFISDVLGLDPLYVANEGKCIVCVPEKDARKAVEIIKASRFGENAAIIGKVISGMGAGVILRTVLGTERVIPLMSGEQLPRIC
ncbi:hydrogenase expression/formation protein HypE [candidate division KSB1 bacterium]